MRQLHFSIPWPFPIQETQECIRFCFLTSVVSFFFFTLVEAMNPGFVSSSINLSILLIPLGVFGVLTYLLPEQPLRKYGLRTVLLSTLLVGIFSSIMIYIQSDSAKQSLRLILTFVGGATIFGLSFVTLRDKLSSSDVE